MNLNIENKSSHAILTMLIKKHDLNLKNVFKFYKGVTDSWYSAKNDRTDNLKSVDILKELDGWPTTVEEFIDIYNSIYHTYGKSSALNLEKESCLDKNKILTYFMQESDIELSGLKKIALSQYESNHESFNSLLAILSKHNQKLYESIVLELLKHKDIKLTAPFYLNTNFLLKALKSSDDDIFIKNTLIFLKNNMAVKRYSYQDTKYEREHNDSKIEDFSKERLFYLIQFPDFISYLHKNIYFDVEKNIINKLIKHYDSSQIFKKISYNNDLLIELLKQKSEQYILEQVFQNYMASHNIRDIISLAKNSHIDPHHLFTKNKTIDWFIIDIVKIERNKELLNFMAIELLIKITTDKNIGKSTILDIKKTWGHDPYTKTGFNQILKKYVQPEYHKIFDLNKSLDLDEGTLKSLFYINQPVAQIELSL